MYKRLLRLVNQFVHIERGSLHAFRGRILDVDQDVVELQTYNRSGKAESRWLISLAAITAVSIEDRVLEELALSVQWANSPDEEPPTEARQESPVLETEEK